MTRFRPTTPRNRPTSDLRSATRRGWERSHSRWRIEATLAVADRSHSWRGNELTSGRGTPACSARTPAPRLAEISIWTDPAFPLTLPRTTIRASVSGTAEPTDRDDQSWT